MKDLGNLRVGHECDAPGYRRFRKEVLPAGQGVFEYLGVKEVKV